VSKILHQRVRFGFPVATWSLHDEQQFDAFQMVIELELIVEIKMYYWKGLYAYIVIKLSLSRWVDDLYDLEPNSGSLTWLNIHDEVNIF
jgi:hypothetical protein